MQRDPRKLITRHTRLWLISGFAFLLSGCGSVIPNLPFELPTFRTESSPVSTQQPALSGEQDPQKLLSLGLSQQGYLRNQYLLEAAHRFRDIGLNSQENQALSQLDQSYLTGDLLAQFDILRARQEITAGAGDRSLSILAQINRPEQLRYPSNARFYRAEARAHELQNTPGHALISRIKLDKLSASNEPIQNQRLILQLLKQLNGSGASIPRTQNLPELNGWIALSQLPRNAEQFDQHLSAWRYSYPNHPAHEHELFPSAVIDGQHPERIALLLPLNSPFASAAEAFERGFRKARASSNAQTTITTYDTGSDANAIAQHYLTAVSQGADMVIGPFGRQSVEALLTQATLSLPTLLIGSLPTTQGSVVSPPANAWFLSLSPEEEARAAAQKAYADGHRQAVMLSKNNAWGARVSSAFKTEFESLGGAVVGNSRYLANGSDTNDAVKRTLSLNQSENRHARLEASLGRKLGFNPRRRDDVSFIFLAANASEARFIVPQIKFYNAHRLPLYSVSSTFSGRSDPVSDADLVGLRFPDIPWMLQGLQSTANSGTSTRSRLNSVSRQLPFGGSPLDRLYALGHAAFNVIPHLTQFATNPRYSFTDTTMALTMTGQNTLQRVFSWARYSRQGIVIDAPP